ncbi:MAG: hypothetical protein CM15mP42_11760 [Methanobacteriota archaeon]|nr:MAG: hypothetical protein CM15mP42_11760 [Euryarchaeota archaeon]
MQGIFDQYSGDDDALDENEYQTFVSKLQVLMMGSLYFYNIDTQKGFLITSPKRL